MCIASEDQVVVNLIDDGATLSHKDRPPAVVNEGAEESRHVHLDVGSNQLRKTRSASMQRIDELLKFIEAYDLSSHIVPEIDRILEGYIRFETPNIAGGSIGRVIPVRNAADFVKQGMPLFGLPIWMMTNWGIANHPYWSEKGFCNVTLIPDMDTLKIVGHQCDMIRVICDQTLNEVERLPCPRTVCKAALAQLKQEFDLEIISALEFEFQLLKKKSLVEIEEDETPRDLKTDYVPCWNNLDIFSTRQTMKHMDFIESFESSFLGLGIDINTMHTEYAPGQLEISIKPRSGIKGADCAFTFKTGVKEVAESRGILATFMTKPFGDASTACANGGHFNHSLWHTDTKSGRKRNVFWNGNGGLTNTARWWIGGILKHHDALCALSNPTKNCYDRIKDFSWAPTRETWGMDNRTLLIRAKADSEEGCYLEYRGASSAQNAYHVLTAIVLAGMDGLRNKLDPGAMTTGNGYVDSKNKRLPDSLSEALEALKKSELFNEGFGKQYIELFCTTKEAEIVAVSVKQLEIGKLRADQDMYLRNA